MSYSLDVEHFISEIGRRPVIWNLHNEEHRHKNLKLKAWEEVTRNFIPDFDDMSNLEKEEVYRKLHGKWRNIRDSYVRNKKKRPGQKTYMYAKHLKFLDDVYKQTDGDDDDSNEEGDTKKKQNRFADIESWQSDSENSLEESKKKKVKTEENPLEYFESPIIADATSCSFPIEDEDKSFFDSLLPAVRSFDIDQKLEFRSEVLSLIKKIRLHQK